MVEEQKVIPVDRPGCVSFYAVLMFLSGGLIIVVSVMMSLGVSSESISAAAVTISIVGGIVAIFCLIPIVVIAILTLLGPQIANVFSRITDGLG